jgi:hypothetical protein
MTKDQHEKLADFFYQTYQFEKIKASPDEFLLNYFQDMMMFHEGKSKRYTKEYANG